MGERWGQIVEVIHRGGFPHLPFFAKGGELHRPQSIPHQAKAELYGRSDHDLQRVSSRPETRQEQIDALIPHATAAPMLSVPRREP
ncbi:hypothetical protein D3C85_1787970 [compost metagenome]